MSPLLTLSAIGAGEARPFPQHIKYTAGTIKPSSSQPELDKAVVDFYRIWKAKYLRSTGDDQRYVFCNSENTFPKRVLSVSEGHGYGMLLAVLMAGADPDAHADFDGLYHFFRQHPAEDNPNLMAWRQISTKKGKITEGPDDRDTATDGDMDIACALLMADAQWGSRGAINYRKEAGKVIAAILKSETDPERHTLTLGSWVDAKCPHWGGLRSSDFMPTHLKAFAAESGNAEWTQITDTTYRIFSEIVAAQNTKTGLIPDFIVSTKKAYLPAPPKYLEDANDECYYFNACRVPWRLGTDYLLSGDQRALVLLQPLNAWIRQATGGNPKKINAGHRLDGKPLDKDECIAFNAPFAIAAMCETANQEWLDALWVDLLKRNPDDESYYGNTLKMLTMIVVSGNWWQ